MVQQHICDRRTYRGFVLDPFQREALEHIDGGYSVLVAAPTGVGKTLIADYLIEKVFRQDGRVVYTAPIKALSNQKFKEFKAHVGEDAVGILTGDVVINPEAPILIMTTEIFRNLLQLSPERVSDVRYVIFDEIHYIDDPQRGSVWEESLIFMPPSMRFLGLSATIPNVHELADWISSIHNQEIKVVTHFERAVPLTHAVYEKSMGITSLKKVKKRYRNLLKNLKDQQSWQRERLPATSHIDLISEIKDGYLPCLFFAFSRRKCETCAAELGEHFDFLDSDQKQEVEQVIRQVAQRYPDMSSERWKKLYHLVRRGIGYHHAGMLPALKDVVEELFLHRLLPVLYCTETFAVGINFPCRTVCFESPTKWDGTTFRAISNREYFQMAGRAGRRGIDDKGFVFTMIDLNYFDPRDFPSMKESEIEPLQSQFSLTYNSVLNLIKNYDQENIPRILGQNFAAYQAGSRRELVRAEIGLLKDQLAPYCPDMEENCCPINYQRLVRKQKKLQNKQYHKNQKAQARRSAQQLAELEELLAKTECRSCSHVQQKECRRQYKEYRGLVHRYQRLIRKARELDPEARYFQEFEDKRGLLVALGYLRGDSLTTAGLFASQIHGQELLVTEMFMEGLLQEYSVAELNAIFVSIGYEPRKNETKVKHRLNLAAVQKIVYQLRTMEEKFLGYSTVEFHDHLAALAYRWSMGASFNELVGETAVDEGDIVFAFRRGIDLLRQVRNAVAEDPYLSGKMRDCMTKMDRDEVSIWL